MQEREVEQRSKVFDKTRMKRIDVNISEGGNRPTESRKKIEQIFRDGQRQFKKDHTQQERRYKILGPVVSPGSVPVSADWTIIPSFSLRFLNCPLMPMYA